METEIIRKTKFTAPRREVPRIDSREVNAIVRDLLVPNARIYWGDLILSASVGWFSFLLLIFSTSHYIQAGCYILSVIFLFRCLFFIHEISHQASSLPGFVRAWNALVGLPMLVPSFLYETVHLDHHRRHKYGTLEDPEYLPLALQGRSAIVIFLVKTLIFPLAFAVRFLVLAPIGLLIPSFHRWLETRASALIINETYLRPQLTPVERKRMKLIEVSILVFWSGVFTLVKLGVLPTSLFLYWYGVIFGIALINQARTLVAHRYTNPNQEMQYDEQLLDSINVEGGWFTELWAPVGARYHALHHFLPKLPYHALPEAHRRMKKRFDHNAIYPQVNEKSFLSAFRKLWKVAGALVILIALPVVASVDPCYDRIIESIKYKENRSVIKSGLKNLEQVHELSTLPIAQTHDELDNQYLSANRHFGRYFVASFVRESAIFWMLPYAQGKACVLRRVSKMQTF